MSTRTGESTVVEVLVRRWEWRLLGSDEGRRPERVRDLARQSQEELEAFIQERRSDLAANAKVTDQKLTAARERVAALADRVPPEADPPAPSGAAVLSSRVRLGIPMAILLTLAMMVLAVLATGAVVDLTAASTFVPVAAVTLLAAVVGGVAGSALSLERSRWAVGIAAIVLVLGALAAFLVAWVAGLALERRLLLAVVFVMLAAMSGAIWAFRSAAAQPREVRLDDRRRRRQYDTAVSERQARQAELDAAQAALSEAEEAASRAEARLSGFDEVAAAWRKEMASVGERACATL